MKVTLKQVICGIMLVSCLSIIMDQAIANPCNPDFVKQAPNELVIKVAPNGVDDTENIQCALNWAVDTGMPVVKLSADTFYISSLVIEKFNGSLQGITTETSLIVVLDDSISCTAMADSGRVPAAIKFIKGEPRLRYLTIHANAACKAGVRWDPRFLAIVHFTGDAADSSLCTNDVIFGSVDRVIVDGTSRATGPWWSILVGAESDNFNVCQGRLMGSFKLNRSALANTKYGISSAMKSGAQVDINFNSFVGNLSGVWMIDSNQNTTITRNEFFGESTASEPHFSIMLASSANAPDATRVVVNNNDFNLNSPSGRNCIGVLTQQPGKVVNISNIVTKNRFSLSGNTSWAVMATDVSNTHVSTNRFTGTAQGAVLVSGTVPVKGWTITANSGLKDFKPSSLRDIWLRENTNQCIVGPGQWATVNDLGSGNSVLGLFSASPLALQDKPEPLIDPTYASGQISEALAEEIKAFARTETWVAQHLTGTKPGYKGRSQNVTQSSLATTSQPEGLPNPCDSSHVNQAPNELFIKVSPTGIDDTENVQCALKWAVDTGMPVVKLSADRFYISSLSIKNFNGSLQGIGRDSTFIEILDKSVACVSMGVSGQISAAIKFIEGEPRLRFMTIQAHRACINDLQLETIVQFTGKPADTPVCGSDVVFGTVDRVAIDGIDKSTGPELAIKVGAESDYFFGGCQRKLLGTFKLNRSSLSNTESGIATSMKSGAQVDINFSTFTGNRYSVEIYNANQNTTITANKFYGYPTDTINIDDGYYGISFTSGIDAPKTNSVVIHNNDFNISAPSGFNCSGVFAGSRGDHTISSVITNNRFLLNGDHTWGIKALGVSNTHVSTNRFTGNAAGAINVYGDDPVTGWTITANNGLKDFISSSASDILLDVNTSRCIVGPGQGATVNNLGANNALLSSIAPSPTVMVNPD